MNFQRSIGLNSQSMLYEMLGDKRAGMFIEYATLFAKVERACEAAGISFDSTPFDLMIMYVYRKRIDKVFGVFVEEDVFPLKYHSMHDIDTLIEKGTKETESWLRSEGMLGDNESLEDAIGGQE